MLHSVKIWQCARESKNCFYFFTYSFGLWQAACSCGAQARWHCLAWALLQVDVQRARLPQTRAKGEYEMENTIKVLQHKESKLSGE